jgi:hypothetical protein
MMKPENRLSLAAARARGSGIESLKPTSNNLLQKCPVAKRVNSSRADDNGPTFIDKIELAVA